MAHTAAYQIAQVHAWWGERDAAFEWLERAYRQHDAGFWCAKVDPYLRPLNGEPRFEALLKATGASS
jgi:serine/threonine-protein kinase